ncbi:MAG: ATP-binding cassette domain-containing protein, partial [Planctomycetales bacterium]
MSSFILITRNLGKQYGDTRALTDCNLEVEAGEVFGLLGPNGAGKTTLIRLVMGFLRPTTGGAFVDGRDCLRESVEVHRRTAYLPGEARLFRSMRGRTALRFFSEVHPRGNFDQALRTAERLDVDLSRRVSACSSGMRQKLSLAAVFSLQAPLMVLDEPTTHLDPTARRETLKLVRECQLAGRTVLFSSHVLSEVEEVCDRV